MGLKGPKRVSRNKRSMGVSSTKPYPPKMRMHLSVARTAVSVAASLAIAASVAHSRPWLSNQAAL